MNPLDNAAMQALSDAGAQCGVCGDQPGDRICPDCEHCYEQYVAALRAAGWAPQAEAVGEAADVLAQAFLEETDPVRADAVIEALIRVRRILPCTCARSGGLHEKACQRYVPGHELISPALRISHARAELSADQPIP